MEKMSFIPSIFPLTSPFSPITAFMSLSSISLFVQLAPLCSLLESCNYLNSVSFASLILNTSIQTHVCKFLSNCLLARPLVLRFTPFLYGVTTYLSFIEYLLVSGSFQAYRSLSRRQIDLLSEV